MTSTDRTAARRDEMNDHWARGGEACAVCGEVVWGGLEDLEWRRYCYGCAERVFGLSVWGEPIETHQQSDPAPLRADGEEA
jgi:hypothetical protein